MDGVKLIEKGEILLVELINIERNVLENKDVLLKKKGDEILNLIPNDFQKINFGEVEKKLVGKYKARCYYIRGKVLEMIFDPSTKEHCKEALNMLKRAVLLNNSLTESWNTLGHLYQKLKDFDQSKSCYEKSLSVEKNWGAYIGLSTVIRMVKTEERFKKSVEYAKGAIKLDFKNAKCWYVLGNSYLYQYFSTHSEEDMEKAAKAYNCSEQNVTAEKFYTLLPEINHNRSVLYQFEGEYGKAYEGFSKSYEMDKTMEVSRVKMKEVEQLMEVIDEITSEKRGKKFLKKLGEKIKTPSKLGSIVGKQISLMIVCLVSDKNSTPLVYVAVDKEVKYCIVSVYFVKSDVIKDEGVVTIISPSLENASIFSGKSKKEISKIKVRNVNLLRVNGRLIEKDDLLPITMSSTYSK